MAEVAEARARAGVPLKRPSHVSSRATTALNTFPRSRRCGTCVQDGSRLDSGKKTRIGRQLRACKNACTQPPRGRQHACPPPTTRLRGGQPRQPSSRVASSTLACPSRHAPSHVAHGMWPQALRNHDNASDTHTQPSMASQAVSRDPWRCAAPELAGTIEHRYIATTCMDPARLSHPHPRTEIHTHNQAHTHIHPSLSNPQHPARRPITRRSLQIHQTKTHVLERLAKRCPRRRHLC